MTESDLLRENAELVANNVRLREALESAKLCHNPNGSRCWCHPSNKEGRHEQHCMWIRDRADETPVQSLEAIRAKEVLNGIRTGD